MANKTPKKKNASKYLVGAGVAAAIAGGIIGFLTQTKKGKEIALNGKKHAADITKHIAMKAEKMKTLSKEKYEEIVDDIVAEYQKKKKLTKSAAEELSKELKKEWAQIRKELKK